jgi:hypothetical protein
MNNVDTPTKSTSTKQTTPIGGHKEDEILTLPEIQVMGVPEEPPPLAYHRPVNSSVPKEHLLNEPHLSIPVIYLTKTKKILIFVVFYMFVDFLYGAEQHYNQRQLTS